MDTVAASGGYITAIAADHIVARGNTITGSIGVIFSVPGNLASCSIRSASRWRRSSPASSRPSPRPTSRSPTRRAKSRMPWCRTASPGSPAWLPNAASCRSSGCRCSPTAASIPAARPWPRSSSMTSAARKRPSTGWRRTRRSAPISKIVDWNVADQRRSTGLGFSAAELVLQRSGPRRPAPAGRTRQA